MITFNSEKFKREIKNDLSEILNNSLKGVKDFIGMMKDPYSGLGMIIGLITLFLLFAMGLTRGEKENLFSMDNFLKAIKYIFQKSTVQNAEHFLMGTLLFGGVIFAMIVLGVLVTKLITSIEVN